MKMGDYDIIVVGGGPSGSASARTAALKGNRVLLIDRARFPREKTCAGGVRDVVWKVLDIDGKSVIQRRIYGQRFYSPSGALTECIRDEAVGSTVMRAEFDHFLLKKAAEAGAEIWEGIGVVKAEQDGGRVEVLLDDGRRITGQFLVGADGINSTVAKSLGFYTGWPADRAAIAIEIEAEVGEDVVTAICGVPYDKEGCSIDIYFGPVPYGYIWCFPKRSILSLGAGCRQDRARNIRRYFNKWLEEFKQKHAIDLQIVSDTAARLPYSGAAERTVINRTILVGDAAGFVNPYSGEGIPMAVISGVMAGEVVDAALKEGDPKKLHLYERRWKAEFADDLHVGKSIANLMFKSEKNMETILGLAHRDEYIRDIMYKMIAGLDTYKNLKAALVKRILRKHPRAGLSLYL